MISNPHFFLLTDYIVFVWRLVSVSLFITTLKNGFETSIGTLALVYAAGKLGGAVLPVAVAKNCQPKSFS